LRVSQRRLDLGLVFRIGRVSLKVDFLGLDDRLTARPTV
jgi:hypothetical protein